jgi:hypothetical protein
MKKLLSVLLATVFSAVAAASSSFYVLPNSYPNWSSTLDVLWQNSAIGTLEETNLESYSNGYNLNELSAGPITVDVGLGGLGGTATTAQIFAGDFTNAKGCIDGTVWSKALLNRDSSGGIHSEITFTFSSPVKGVGAWVFDDNRRSAESFQMIVTEVGGKIFTGGPLESGNTLGDLYPHFVEGFIGATSRVGITGVSFRVVDSVTLQPISGKFFELDHLQLIHAPIPDASMLGAIGVAVIGWLRARRTF